MTMWAGYSRNDAVRRCAVKLTDRAGTFLGSGFFIAHRVVVTCAHVVHAIADDDLIVRSSSRLEHPGKVLVRDPERASNARKYPFPDVAFIGVETLDNPQPFVGSKTLSLNTELELFGYSRYTPEAGEVEDTAIVTVAGLGGRYVKVAGPNVVPGMSGAPAVLDGTICGMLKAGPQERGNVGFLIHGEDLRRAFSRHKAVLRGYMRSQPPLVRPEPGTEHYEFFRAQSGLAQEYPYGVGSLSRRERPKLSTVYVEQRTEARVEQQRVKTTSLAPPPEPIVISPLEMLRRHRNALIVGGPGGGKSTLLQQLVHESAAWWLRPEPRIVEDEHDEPPFGRVIAVRCAATDLLRGGPWFESIALAVNNELRGFANLRIPADRFERPPTPGAEWLILVDGLDEVIDTAERERLIRMLGFRVGQYGSSTRFVVTSRRLDEREFQQLRASLEPGAAGDRLGEYNLRQFDEPAVSQFAHNWFKPAEGQQSETDPVEFLDAIAATGLNSLVQVPLLATIAAIVYEEQPSSPLPIDRAGLYGEFVKVLLTRRNQRLGSLELLLEQLRPLGRSAYDFGNFLFDRRLDLLSEIAVRRMHGDVRPALALAEAWVRQQGERPPLGVESSHIREVLLSTGLLVAQRDDLVFIHQSFAEYLADRVKPAEFNAEDWLTHVRSGGPDSRGMFALAAWVREGNDPLPVMKNLLEPGPGRTYPGLGDAALVIEDGAALIGEDAGDAVVRLAEDAVRDVRPEGERTVPMLNQALRALLRRARDRPILITLAGDASLATVKRVEAARVLIADGSADERATGLRALTDLVYATRLRDEDELWALYVMADVGGASERAHALQRLVAAVETTSREATRVRALILLARLEESTAAALALVRRGVDPHRPAAERLQALYIFFLFTNTEDGTGLARSAAHAGNLDFNSRYWCAPHPEDATAVRKAPTSEYQDMVGGALWFAAAEDPDSALALVHTVMSDRTLAWTQRRTIAQVLRDWPSLMAAALLRLAEDENEAPFLRAMGAYMYAESVDAAATHELLTRWMGDRRQPRELRRRALTLLADLHPRTLATAMGDEGLAVGDRRRAAMAYAKVSTNGRDEAMRMLAAASGASTQPTQRVMLTFSRSWLRIRAFVDKVRDTLEGPQENGHS